MIIYTAIFAGYDRLKPLPEGVQGVCFTDTPMAARGWEVRPAAYHDADPCMRARHHKCMPHELFPYEDTLWLDGSMELVALPPAAEFAAFPHKAGVSSIAGEIAACAKVGKIDAAQRDLAADRLRRWTDEGYIDGQGHPETGVIVRSDTPRVREFNALWWDAVQEIPRDQLSCDWALWMTRLPWTRLEGTAARNAYVVHSRHGGERVPKVHYIVPYSREGLGVACNEACAIVPAGDWVCLMDMDVMLFGNWGKQIEDVIMAHPQFDVFTCKVTRINPNGYKHLHDAPDQQDERDLTRLYARAAARSNDHYGEVTECVQSLAGYFLLFRKSLWREVPFPVEGIPVAIGGKRAPGRVLGIDSAWSVALQRAGKRCAVIDGLLAVHFYRLGVNKAEHCAFLEKSVTPRPAAPCMERAPGRWSRTRKAAGL